jgi:hypothetical protein
MDGSHFCKGEFPKNKPRWLIGQKKIGFRLIEHDLIGNAQPVAQNITTRINKALVDGLFPSCSLGTRHNQAATATT